MNDTELDRLLDDWKAPAASPSLREGLRARFPRAQRHRFPRPLRLVLVIAVASATLAIGMERGRENPWGVRIVSVLNGLYEGVVDRVEIWRANSLVAQIRESRPKVYVDGQLVAPLQYGRAATMEVQVPGVGVYSITSYPILTPWVEAGHIYGNVIEFQAGGRQVRIECDKPIVDSDRPVFALRRP
jgi:hypothetical protein